MSNEDHNQFMELLNKQQTSYDKIKSVQSNYKKDSASRKTVDYLNKRVEALQSLWDEFSANHGMMKKHESDYKEHSYFKDNIFHLTRCMFEETMQSMTQLRNELLNEPGFSGIVKSKTSDVHVTPKFNTSGNSFGEETDKNLSTLIRKQMCNFNAFERAVSKINLEDLKGKWQIQDKLNVLESKWESIDIIHWEINYLLQGSDEEYTQRFEHWEQIYDELKEDLGRKMFETSHYEKSTPRVELPEFNGNYNSWISFRDLFLEMIHNNPTLNKAQKMKHLKSKLKGEAEKLVKHLSVSAENYDSCLSIIQHRYNNNRLLFTSYIDMLLEQAPINKSNPESLKKLHDTTRECLYGLENININIPVWGPIIVHLISAKLDDETYDDYIKNMKHSRELPDLDEFMEFLESKFISREISRNKKGKHEHSNMQNKNNYYNYKSTTYKESGKCTKTYHIALRKCPQCKNDHALRQCPTFLNMDVALRNKITNKLNLCKNCLFSHGENKSTSTKRCRTCNLKHHSLLHDDNFKRQEPKPSTSTTTERSSNHVNAGQEILLTTLQLKVKNKEGIYVILRALLDQGSQVTLITENAAQLLNLPRNKTNAAVTGVGSIMGTSKGMIKLECQSIHSDYTFTTDALVMRKLVNNLPHAKIDTSGWTHLQNIQLADPTFNIPGPIDLLLGADTYSNVILDGVLKYSSESPVAQQTKLGWILCGATKQYNCLVTLSELDGLSQFWETEDIPSESESTIQDDYCEKYYTETVQRLNNGRYVVKMPMKPNFEQNLGNSKHHAIAQFHQLEKKMSKQERFADLYKQFIREYIELGHMIPVTNNNKQIQSFLPHHGVLRESSSTTKLRAVFNASLKTDSGYSLNDLMEKGPNLQKDIMSLIIKWRSYKYVLTADIDKFYRQIVIHHSQQNLQRIIWRDSVSTPLMEMQLTTLTYGTKAAPFLAMRTLQQLAQDEGHAFPLGQKALQNDLYMDDVITGHHFKDSTTTLQRELYELLKKGGFILRKWATNEPSILKQVNECNISETNEFTFKNQEFSKTLGLTCNSISDTFHFTSEVSNMLKNTPYTKRHLLSEISKIYDPLGWLAPITIQAKLLFQKLWSEKFQNIGWDEKVPEFIEKEWLKIKNDLININKFSLPRWIKSEYNNTIELQAFCDASEQAYACVIYTRTTSPNGAYVTTLLAAKTKVTPLKNKITIPKLELCAAVLLAKLIQKIMTILQEYHLKISCWTDSKVVLAWLQGNQTKYEKFITNRTTQITSIVPVICWGYVKTNENPADCATRGLLPSKLADFSLWWEGPGWLREQDNKANNLNAESYTTNEGYLINCYSTNSTEPVQNKSILINSLIERYSDLDRITRVLAWVIRFPDVIQNKQKRCNELQLSEINNALYTIIKFIQEDYFEKEITSLKKSGKVLNRSPILKLNPFLNSKGILCVGGRLEHSNLPENARHPMIIPSQSRLTQLIIEQAHKQTLHGGARLTLAHTRNRYWIVSGNRIVKKTLRQCVRCRRYATTRTEQLMGNLPRERITPSRPFTHTGVDFTGHVDIKINKGRGIKTCKGYIAIFICMSTKAVHIELVSDLSTETFLSALKRMCARRGTPRHIYSDNGTNFVGAAKVLKEEFQHYQTLMSSEFFKEVKKLQIEWHFNAPSWPTAGGLWEAAVRSMKMHLKRVIGQQKLTFEQFSTLLAQIEACMNSRPLSAMSEDVEDLDYLTPGHFLTGTPTLSLPLDDPQELRSVDLRNNWRLIELMRRHYWDRWSKEYLHLLQNRDKWQQTKENLQKGQLVLVKENNLPPGKWAMGRVMDLHPGTDKLVRVVTLKTQNGVLKRPITKLAPLPINKCDNVNDPKRGSSEPEDNCNQRKKRVKESQKRINSLFMVFLVAFTTLSGVRAEPVQHYQITQLPGHRPLYFDPAGNVQLIHDEWKLLVYYNMTTFWQCTSKVENFINHLSQLCEAIPNEPCHATIHQLKFEMNQIYEYNELLSSQHLQRNRRGYVDGVGNLARTLFGVLDSDFANKYARDINNIKTNENYLLKLIRNQTFIIEAENNIIKKNEHFVKTQLETIQRYMSENRLYETTIENRFQVMKTMNDINAGAVTASLLLSTLRGSQQMLLDALADIYRGHLDRNIFTPKQLSEQLNYIAGVISKKLTLPLKNRSEQNLQNIYKLIYVKARLTEQYLLFELHIPLLSDDEYALYNNIPILTRKQNTAGQCQQIQTRTKYIGVNFVKNTYIQIEETDLQQCTALMEDHYVCHAYTSIHNMHGATASCEAKLLSQHTENIICDWVSGQCSDQWIKLQRPNIWLYNCPTECRARVVCDNHISTTSLTSSGLLALGQDCVIQHKDVTIYSHNTYNSKINLGMMSLEVPLIDSPNELWNIGQHSRIILPTQNLSADHAELERKINIQKAREMLPEPLTIHDIGNYTLSSLIVGGIIISLILWRLRKYLISKKKNTAIKRNEDMELAEISDTAAPGVSPNEFKL